VGQPRTVQRRQRASHPRSLVTLNDLISRTYRVKFPWGTEPRSVPHDIALEDEGAFCEAFNRNVSHQRDRGSVCDTPQEVHAWKLLLIDPTQRRKATPCQLSETAYSTNSQLVTIAGGRIRQPQLEDEPCGGDNATA
jgi:hypothetical protein